MKLITLLIAALVASAAFAGSAKTGKLVGHVDIGPLTPVERPGVKPKVPPEMYRHYSIQITQPGPHNGRMKSHLIRIVTTLKLSDTGDFSTDLSPGDYQVGVIADRPSMRTPARKDVTIKAGSTTKVNIRVDTGIR